MTATEVKEVKESVVTRHHQSQKMNIVILSSLIGVILNVFLAVALSPIATETQKKPPNGAAELNLIDQFMHMIVHHKQVLITSSLIVFIVVCLSTTIAVSLPLSVPFTTENRNMKSTTPLNFQNNQGKKD